jgi:hypothetical protein
MAFDMAASLPRAPVTPVSHLAYFVPAGSSSLLGVMDFLATRGAPVRTLACGDGDVPICVLDAPRLSDALLKSLASNGTLTSAIAPFAIPVVRYAGVLDCRPVPITVGQASSLLADAGLVDATDLRCDGAGLCLFTTTQAETRWRAALPPAVRAVLIVPRTMPIARYRVQVRLRSSVLSTDDFIAIYARTKLQPTSLACAGDTCTVGTFGSTQDEYTQSLTSLSSFLTEATVRRFDTAIGSLVFNSGGVGEGLCQLALLTARIAPANVSVGGATCTFWAHTDVSDGQLGRLRAFPGVIDVSVDYAVTLPSAAAAMTAPRLFRGSVTAASEAVARSTLFQLTLPQPSSCLPSPAFDGMVDCLIQSTDPFPPRLAVQLTSSPAFRAATVPTPFTFASLFEEALRTQIGECTLEALFSCGCVSVLLVRFVVSRRALIPRQHRRSHSLPSG